MGMEPYGAEEPGVESGSSVTDRELDIPLDQARKHAFFWVHLFGMFLLGFVCSAPLRQIFPYVTDLHDATLAATIVALYSFVGIFGKLLLGWITDRIGPIYGAMFAFSLMALSFALLIGGEDRMLLYVMACVYGVGNAVGSVSAPLLISGTFGTRDFNLMRGIAQSPIQLGMSLGGLALAGVFDLIGSYVPGWGACIVLSLLAGGCFIWSYASSRKIFATQMAV